MDDLIIKTLAGEASPFEQERLKRWRTEDPENDLYFREMLQVWQLTAPEVFLPASGPPPVEEILAAAPASVDHGESRNRVRRRFKRQPWVAWSLMAASVAVIGLGIRIVGSGGPGPLAAYEAGPNETRTVTLSDGSFARLAAGSSLEEWEAQGRREVSLSGRAFFAVARNETRPFVVRAGAGEIQVLGTRFQVDAALDEVETVVVEGLVRMSNGMGSVEVPAGSVASMNADATPEVRGVADVFAWLDWPDGVLVFQASPLAQVVQEVSRFYGRDIEIEDANLAQRRVTAWFEGDPFEAVAESLCIVTEAVCRTEGGGIAMGMGGR